MTENTYSIFETKFVDNAIISFDLFGTLLEEPFFHHSDLFELMNPEADRIVGKKNFDFKKIRLLAEKFALKAKKDSETVDLNDIYAEIKKITQLEQSYIMELEKLEIYYDQKFYQPRPIGRHMFDIAKKLNKKIIIIAESYLPKIFIESLLERFGYDKYHELFISSEIKKSKKGNLFPYLAEKMFCESKYFLHIGDDETDDVLIPQQHGFNTMPILSSQESYKESFYYKTIWKENDQHSLFSTRLVNGLLSLKFYQTRDENNLNTDKTAFNNNSYRVGYFGLGPLLLGYVQWLIQKSQEDYVKHIYFLNSNGYFLKHAYDTISVNHYHAPISYDLFSSNKISNLSKLLKPYELYEILDQEFKDITLSDYFYTRFDINLEDYPTIIEKHSLTKDTIISKETHEQLCFAIFEELLPKITQKAHNEKDYYGAYLKYQNLPNPDQSAIVDIGYNDNTQSTLSEIAKQKIGGYYLFTFVDTIENIKKNQIPISGYLGNFEEKSCQEISFELLFTTIDKSFSTFELYENTINPTFTEEEHNFSSKKFITEVQEAALDFVADFERIYNKHIPQLYFSPKQIVKPMNYFLTQKTENSNLLKGVSMGKTLNPSNENPNFDLNTNKKENLNLFKSIGKIFLELKKAL